MIPTRLTAAPLHPRSALCITCSLGSRYFSNNSLKSASYLALPEAENHPIGGPQDIIIPSVARAVPLQLLSPEGSVIRRRTVVIRTTVPKAAIDKYN
jgi:hypothetical protein